MVGTTYILVIGPAGPFKVILICGFHTVVDNLATVFTTLNGFQLPHFERFDKDHGSSEKGIITQISVKLGKYLIAGAARHTKCSERSEHNGYM